MRLKMRPSDLKVIRALMGKRLGWTEIQREAQISKGMLSKCLSALIEHGIVLTELDASKRPVRTLYRLNAEIECPICNRCGKWKICSTEQALFRGLKCRE